MWPTLWMRLRVNIHRASVDAHYWCTIHPPSILCPKIKGWAWMLQMRGPWMNFVLLYNSVGSFCSNNYRQKIKVIEWLVMEWWLVFSHLFGLIAAAIDSMMRMLNREESNKNIGMMNESTTRGNRSEPIIEANKVLNFAVPSFKVVRTKESQQWAKAWKE